jgi:hypothetical protein
VKLPRIGALSLDSIAPPSAGVTLLVALAAAGAAFTLSLSQGFGLSDEGMQYFLTREWARGVDISRYGHLGPYLAGQYVILGALMRALGDALWVLRLGRAVLAGLGAAVVLRTLSRHVPLGLALAAALTIGMLDNGYATVLASVLVIAAALTAVRRTPPTRLAVALLAALAGALAGFREDSAAIALALAVAAVAWRRRPDEAATVVLPVAVAGFLPWLLIALARGGAAGFLAQTAGRFADMTTRVAHPHRKAWIVDLAGAAASPRELLELLVPLLAAVPPAVYLAVLLGQWRRHRRGLPLAAPVVAAAACALAYVPQYLLDRMDVTHLRAHFPVFVVAVTVWAGSRDRARHRQLAAGLLAIACAGVVGVAVQHRLGHATPYPCGEGARIGVTLDGGPPPWAGLPRQEGDTLVALGFGPGWYVTEGLVPGTRQLLPFELYLRRPDVLDEVLAGLAAPANRWVIDDTLSAQPPQIRAALAAGYRRCDTWRNWVLYRRR